MDASCWGRLGCFIIVDRDTLDRAVAGSSDVCNDVAADIDFVAGSGQETTGGSNKGLGRKESKGGRHHGVIAPRELGRTVLKQGFTLVAVSAFAGAHGVVGTVSVGDATGSEVGCIAFQGGPSHAHVHRVTRGEEGVDRVVPADEPVVEGLRKVGRRAKGRHEVAGHE